MVMDKTFWQKIKKPIIALAPMDGYTDTAFRRVCKQVNPAIVVFTEFTSADGLSYGAKRLKEKIASHPAEQPIIVQLFGKKPEKFVEAAKVCEAMGFSGIDINMGCPARKVLSSEHGLALRKDPDMACRIVEALANATKLPVSVKTRLGWNGSEDLSEFAQQLENAGANLITIHARFFKEVRYGPVDYEPVYEMKKKLTIPVIGNGSIVSLADGRAKLGNLDGFMIGRASFGNPWVFSEQDSPKTFAEKVPLIKKHIDYLIVYKGMRSAMFEIRTHLRACVHGAANAPHYRAKLARVESPEQAMAILDQIATE